MLKRLMDAIATMEGFYVPGSVPARLHNPGDLVYCGQADARPHVIHGHDGKDRTYCEFMTDADGWNALEKQIRLDAGRGKTLSSFICRYAPDADGNDSRGYLKFICRKTGLTPDTLLQSLIDV